MNDYVVYAHINKINGKIYIGQTRQQLSRRWVPSAYKGCTLFYRAIEKYGWDGFDHVVLKDNLSMVEADCYERYYITHYNSTDSQCGYNCDSGGSLYKKHSEETKEKIRMANIGKQYSDETKAKHSVAMKTRTVIFSDLARQRSVAARSVKISQYNTDGVWIKDWGSIIEASLALQINHQNISRCLKGRAHSAGGYKWSYYGCDIVEPEIDLGVILQIEKCSNSVVAIFDTIQSAEEVTGISKGNICAACKGIRKSAGGYIWKKQYLN